MKIAAALVSLFFTPAALAGILDAQGFVVSHATACVDDGTDSSCQADLQVVSSSTSEASYQVSSPATLDANGSDLGEPQIIDTNNQDAILQRIHEARTYMQTVQTDSKYSKVKHLCKNENSQCTFWAVLGECEKNPGYMEINCGPVCNSCEKKHVATRCPMDPDAVDALRPGDLNKMFENIVTDPFYQQYEPVILSRPDYVNGDTAENATYKIGLWMIMFEKAISDEEADRLIEMGGELGYERSSDVGNEKEDGTFEKNVNKGRTSTNAWCIDNCYTDPMAQNVMNRIANITGIPETNSENLQLLRYENSQFYQTHNDYIPYQLERPCGVRILTFYFYLSDVLDGGGTNFPRNHDLTVQPKKGRAVLWPSVYNHDPNTKDARSDHQAQSVIQGTKYGANAWIHQRDFKENNRIGCS